MPTSVSLQLRAEMPVGIGRLVPSSLGSLGSSKDEGGAAREEMWGLHPIQFGNFAIPEPGM